MSDTTILQTIQDNETAGDRIRAERAYKNAARGSGLNTEYISTVLNQKPQDYEDGTGIAFGSYPVDEHLVQYVQWNEITEQWDDFGSPVTTKEYTDNRGTIGSDGKNPFSLRKGTSSQLENQTINNGEEYYDTDEDRIVAAPQKRYLAGLRDTGRKINTVADLEGDTPSWFETLFSATPKRDMLGYNSVGDGGGGEPYWDVNRDKQDHDGIIVFSPTKGDTTFGDTQNANWYEPDPNDTGTGAWVRDVSNVIDIRKAGAVGDGTTDNSIALEALDSLGGKTVHFPKGLTFSFSNVVFSNRTSFSGKGTIKRINADTDYWITWNNMVDISLEGITIDATEHTSDLFPSALFDNNSNGSKNFKIFNCKILNITANVFEMTGPEPNENVIIDNNYFYGGEERYNVHISSPNNVYGWKITNNVFENVAVAATTNSAGHTDTSDFGQGDILISGNIVREFYPNQDEVPAESMILVRSTTGTGDIVTQRVVISDNIIHGGKKSISFLENPNQNCTQAIIDGNVCTNYRTAAISVGRNNDNQNNKTIIVSNNTCYCDIQTLIDTDAEGVNTRRGISIECSNVLCEGNYVENHTAAGIFVTSDSDVSVLNNTVINSCYSPDFNTGNAAEAGIWIVFGNDIMIHSNKIIGGGFAGSEQVSGIGMNNNNTIYDISIKNNRIRSEGNLPVGILTNRIGGPPFSFNQMIDGNHIDVESLEIYIRNPDDNANTHNIYDNVGWGEVKTTWNPGTVASQDTVTLDVDSVDAFVGDKVEVYFDGINNDPDINSPHLFKVYGRVTAGAVHGANPTNPTVLGTITIYVTNLSGASESFSEAGDLHIRLKRYNYDESLNT